MFAFACRRIAVLIALSGCGVVLGAAAGLGLATDTLGAAVLTVPRCTTASLTVFQNLTAGNVTSVTVGGIAATCAGGTLRVTVDNGDVAGSGSSTVPIGGGAVTVTLSVAPAVGTAERTDLVIEGP